MQRERRDPLLVAVAVLAAILSFVIPMPWGGIPAAIALLIALLLLFMSPRKRGGRP